jgi:hypothetical protein
MKRTSKGFTIEYPDESMYGKPALFKVFFGRKYLIWKGKSFYQSLEYLSYSIKQCIDKGNKDETNFMYHVAAHIIKNGIMAGLCRDKDIYTDFGTDSKDFDGYKILVDEQKMIDDAIRSSLCLNNNVQAYVPENTAYINTQQKERFLRWYEKTHKAWK